MKANFLKAPVHKPTNYKPSTSNSGVRRPIAAGKPVDPYYPPSFSLRISRYSWHLSSSRVNRSPKSSSSRSYRFQCRNILFIPTKLKLQIWSMYLRKIGIPKLRIFILIYCYVPGKAAKPIHFISASMFQFSTNIYLLIITTTKNIPA